MTTTSATASPRPIPFARLLDGFVIFFGCWTLFCNVCVFAGVPFRLFRLLVPVPVLAAACLVVLIPRLSRWQWGRPLDEAGFTSFRWPPVGRLLLPLAAMVLYKFGAGESPGLWVLLVVVVAALTFATDAEPALKPCGEQPVPRKARWVVLGLAICAVCLTLVSDRQDRDDANYVNLAVTAQDHPDWPLLAFDGMHGEEDLRINQLIHRPQSHELLTATVSSWTRLPTLAVYYFVLPCFFAFWTVIAHWVTVSRYLRGWWAVCGLSVTLLVLISWGEQHYGFGNFAFVRMYQGKALLVSIVLPALFYYVPAYLAAPSAGKWLLLGLCQVAGMGFSSTGMALAPLSAGVLLLCSLRPSVGSIRRIAVGLLASLPPLLVCGLLLLEMRQGGGLRHSGIVLPPRAVLGLGFRRDLVLLTLFGLPLFRRRAGWGLLGFYPLAAVLFILNPVVSGVLQHVAKNLSWRLVWCVPFPLLFGLFCGQVASSSERLGGRRRGPVIAAGLVLLFLIDGPWTPAPGNGAQLDLPPRYKMPQEAYRAACGVVEMSGEDTFVLAVPDVAEILPRLHHAPRLVAVRDIYVDNLWAEFGPEEASLRRKLLLSLRGIRGKGFPPRATIEGIRTLGVNLVVTYRAVGTTPPLLRLLQEAGFDEVETIGPYTIWRLGGAAASRGP